MKILMVFSYAPLPPPLDLGGTKRNLPFLLENLKRHEVSVLSYGSKQEEELFLKSYGTHCKQVIFVDRRRAKILNALQYIRLLATFRSPLRMVYRSAMQEALNRVVERTHFDIIHCCTPMLGYFEFPKSSVVISDTHEVTYDLQHRTLQKMKNPIRRALLYAEYRLTRREEPKLLNRFDAVVATTDPDFEIFRKHVDEQKLFVISNGVQQSFLETLPIKEEPETIVFTGLMSYYPNNHGILYFLEDIYPLITREIPRAKVLVVGKNPSRTLLRYASEQIIVTGFVEDVRPYIARARVFAIPLLIGGGIRGKALEAMAMKKPIVTTTLGCEGIHLRHGESALFADTPDAFAKSVVRLLRDEAMRKKLSENAYRVIRRDYDWTTKGGDLTRVYERSLIGHRQPSPKQNVHLSSSQMIN